MTEIKPGKNRSLLPRIFISPDEPRLRAGWRLLLQTVIMIFLSIMISLAVRAVGAAVGDVASILGQVLNLCVITGSVYIARRWLDKRSFESLGLKIDKQSLFDILAGIGITAVQMGFIYISMSVLGWLSFEGFAWEFETGGMVLSNAAFFLLVFVFVGWNEELLSRGYHLQTLASGINMTWAVILSSAVFGIAHLGNPNATWVSAAGIFFAGAYLAYGYLRTKQLWLPIGLHIGWNFFEGVVFGFPVSGLDIYALTRISIHGPEMWTGGAFGPEAGLILLPSLIVGTGLMYWYTNITGNKKPRRGSREARSPNK